MKCGWLLAAAMLVCGAASAQQQTLGPETNLPLPRFVSLKANEANIRRGPHLDYRIDWVFLRRGWPVEVLAEYGQWRRVVDADGAGGWVHHSMLRGRRTGVIVAPEGAYLRADPRETARAVAKAEPGVIARIAQCAPEWCLLEADGYEGWAPKAVFWGARADEVFE